jgi:septum formation topological specificity factor MinE
MKRLVRKLATVVVLVTENGEDEPNLLEDMAYWIFAIIQKYVIRMERYKK